MSKRDRFEMVRTCRREIARAERRLKRLIMDVLPTGSRVRWSRGGYDQSGHVDMHNNSDGLRVINEGTGKTYWITIYDVLQCAEQEPVSEAVAKLALKGST